MSSLYFVVLWHACFSEFFWSDFSVLRVLAYIHSVRMDAAIPSIHW